MAENARKNQASEPDETSVAGHRLNELVHGAAGHKFIQMRKHWAFLSMSRQLTDRLPVELASFQYLKEETSSF